MRERGLKLVHIEEGVVSASSLPMRERGLKYGTIDNLGVIAPVAPHAGAWIEIQLDACEERCEEVAPHAGAWIEIRCDPEPWIPCASRSPCGSVD